jgi:hypothetical protein
VLLLALQELLLVLQELLVLRLSKVYLAQCFL